MAVRIQGASRLISVDRVMQGRRLPYSRRLFFTRPIPMHVARFREH